MIRGLLAALLALFAAAAGATSEGALLYRANVNLDDFASLQRGARTFVNYCLSCHSASYARFGRLAKDLQLPESVVANNLMFVTDKIGNTMTAAMRKQDAKAWFGTAPPDLSVVARARGPDWLNTFLLTFYLDPASPTGVNNVAFRDTAMPHVLWELQGLQHPVYSSETGHGGGEVKRLEGFEIASPGLQSETQYRQTVRDLVNFLVYLGEPAKLVRHGIGVWVIAFLLGYLVIAYRLKKEYWKDVH